MFKPKKTKSIEEETDSYAKMPNWQKRMKMVESDEDRQKRIALKLAKYFWLFGADRIYQRKYFSAYLKFFGNFVVLILVMLMIVQVIVAAIHHIEIHIPVEWMIIGVGGMIGMAIWNGIDILLIKKDGAYREERPSLKERKDKYFEGFKLKKDRKK